MDYKFRFSVAAKTSSAIILLTSIIASCQSSKFPKTGHFSNVKLPARTIASQTEEDIYFSKYLSYQDPKQIIIYCNLNSQKPETCYEINLAESLNSFMKSSKDNRDAPVAILKDRLNFKKQNNDLLRLTEDAKIYNTPLVKSISDKRKQFCSSNATKDINKCLNLYINRDTFSVLNKYQNKFKLNDLEYLYLRNKIQSDLENEFQSVKLSIEKKRSNDSIQ